MSSDETTPPRCEAEDRLSQHGFRLPPVPAVVAGFTPAATDGEMVWTSGQIAMNGDGLLRTGKLGREVDIADAQMCAKTAALQSLSAVKEAIGNLDRIRRIVKLTVFVASEEDFSQQSLIANAASEVFVAAFGHKGVHARSAVGVAGLPFGAPVEVELTATFDSHVRP